MAAWLARGCLLVALLLAGAGLLAQPLQAIPALGARVVDTTATLDTQQRDALEQTLAAIETARGTQVVVLLVATTAPEDIASYANRVANTWKIGRRDIGDGVLVVVAKNDRRLRIEVAKALEGAIPDLAAKRIIDEAITPRLRQNDYAGALQAGAAQLDARIAGEKLPLPQSPQPQSEWSGDGMAMLVFALFFVGPMAAGVLRGMLGRRLGAVATGLGVGAVAGGVLQLGWLLAAGAALAAFVIALMAGAATLLRPQLPGPRGRVRRHPGGWIGGAGGGLGGGWAGGGGWSGGGGFGSGGGGDFGGGGASGDW